MPRTSLIAIAMGCCVWCAACKKPTTTAPTETSTATPKPKPTEENVEDDTLTFALDKGMLSNRFVREGDLTAHALTRSGTEPRIIAAFPAGNSGAGVWFEETDQPVTLELSALSPVEREGMRGVTFDVTADADGLVVEKAVASSVRVLRNYMHQRKLPEQYEHSVEVKPGLVRWSRDAVDGKTRYVIEIAATEDGAELEKGEDGKISMKGGDEGKPIRLVVTALNDEPRLTPIPKNELVNEQAADDPDALNVLALLSYREKLLAGSWRFLTYFGRDTLLSVRLLMPVLQPVAIEAGIGSVLERLADDGRVAHEEDIGEWAAFRHLADREETSREPLYDYTNVDDDLMLTPVAAHYLLDDERATDRASEFLGRKTPSGKTFREALRTNIDFVLKKASPYADDPRPTNLVSLMEGHGDGEWRDSEEGLGRDGRIPYDCNVALMPAALEASARLLESELFSEPQAAATAREMLPNWQKTHEVFEVKLPARTVKKEVLTYAKSLGLDTESLQSEFPDEPLVFPSLVLDDNAKPMRVMHSDDGFALLFTHPSPERLERTAQRIQLPFPIGLKTDVGILVSNAGYAGKKTEKLFTRNHYHGATVWSWQQAMMAEGIARQLRRDDLPESTRAALRSAQKTLWPLIESTRDVANEELWSWKYEGGKYEVVPFGQQGGDITESNAAQLWSSVYLAVQPPAE